MAGTNPIVVIGSINMDLVCRTPAIPRAGETILGSDFVTIPGGKGANQAVAAAKLLDSESGGVVQMVGRVGDDDFGQRLLNGLKLHNVRTEHVTITEGVASGVAMILVDKKGENSIVVAPGANAKLSPADIDAAESLIRTASVVVLQLEIPLPTVRHAIATCQRLGVFTILDPAPAPPKGLPRAFFGVDLLTPNQGEAERLVDRVQTHKVRTRKIIDPKQIGMDLLARGPKAIALKLGNRGAMLLDREGDIRRFKPHKVAAVDTTAAGDAFTAAMAVGRAEGRSLVDSARFANAAGALACAAFGAQPSLPGREEVDKLLDRKS
jgi:ribokinase